jgi:hypothetical protein
VPQYGKVPKQVQYHSMVQSATMRCSEMKPLTLQGNSGTRQLLRPPMQPMQHAETSRNLNSARCWSGPCETDEKFLFPRSVHPARGGQVVGTRAVFMPICGQVVVSPFPLDGVCDGVYVGAGGQAGAGACSNNNIEHKVFSIQYACSGRMQDQSRCGSRVCLAVVVAPRLAVQE